MNRALKLINKKILFGIVVLAGFNLILAAAVFLFFKPSLETDQTSLRSAKSQLNQARTEMIELSQEVEEIEARKAEFEILRGAGFFSDQADRAVVRDAISGAANVTGIIDLNFRIQAATCLKNKELENSDYVIVASPIDIDLSAANDRNIYQFLSFFQDTLPGFGLVRRVEVRTNDDKELSADTLREISTGAQVPLVEGIIGMTWYTLANQSEVECQQ